NKTALKLAGSEYHGHTELLAVRSGASEYAMMMTGDRLCVVLVTIHIPFQEIARRLSIDRIMSIIEITDDSLKERFGIANPKIAVAGLNPHAGESGMFGDEEARIIGPAVEFSQKNGIDVSGPYPPDTVFYKALKGEFDAVVCMYHDQGLIPFKMIHFSDGVNTTLGLPIIRTSVDHGTAYDIAGKGIADPGSLIQAIRLAALQAKNQMQRKVTVS
ncbi:MAG: 4-hydroxythreonine-4-phosphate dehydrogenase PdxA, partial [Desulfobacterales bacterium]